MVAQNNARQTIWFSQEPGRIGRQNAKDWVSEESVPESLLAPSSMHSLLELARMQNAHEVLLTEAEIYDPVSKDFRATAAMGLPRAYHAATGLSNGTVLVTGGATGTNTLTEKTEIYVP